MTPPAVDWRTVHAKLRRLRALLDQLAALGPVDRARLDAEPVTSLAVERVLTLLVELAFSVNTHVVTARLGRAVDTYGESFALAADVGLLPAALAAELRPSVGLRNVLVHAYLDVDPDHVVAAVPLALTQYGAYVREVAAFLAREQPRDDRG